MTAIWPQFIKPSIRINNFFPPERKQKSEVAHGIYAIPDEVVNMSR